MSTSARQCAWTRCNALVTRAVQGTGNHDLWTRRQERGVLDSVGWPFLTPLDLPDAILASTWKALQRRLCCVNVLSKLRVIQGLCMVRTLDTSFEVAIQRRQAGGSAPAVRGVWSAHRACAGAQQHGLCGMNAVLSVQTAGPAGKDMYREVAEHSSASGERQGQGANAHMKVEVPVCFHSPTSHDDLRRTPGCLARVLGSCRWAACGSHPSTPGTMRRSTASPTSPGRRPWRT